MIDKLHKTPGPLLLLAGPGTGKTFRLAQRIKYLIEENNVKPDQISVITFTSAAAANLRRRISDTGSQELFIPPKNQPPTISTMHSLGHRIIAEKAKSIGLPRNITVVRSDRLRDVLMGDAAQLAGFSRDTWRLTSNCRQFGDCKRDGDNSKCKICHCYEDILRACDAIDHDDQILLACKLLKKDKQLLLRFRQQTFHLLVDEYQDINAGQFELIRLLSKGQLEGLFVVGDDDQSIYSWRGGSPKFIRNFKSDFGVNARVISLSHSYRCHPRIIEGAQGVVQEHDKDRIGKDISTYDTNDGPKICIHNVPSGERESEIIRYIIADLDQSNSVLVLVPNRRYIPPITNQLRKARIQYVAPAPIPGQGFLVVERLACWLDNEDDSLALRECIEALLNSKIIRLPSAKVRKPEKKEQRDKSYHLISSLWKRSMEQGESLWAALEKEHARQELIRVIYESLDNAKSFEKKVPDFLRHIALYLEPWSNKDSFLEEIVGWVNRDEIGYGSGLLPQVQIMTFQGAKGLEADTVCIVGLEEGIIPRDEVDSDAIAEQSRLLYVSMTRAKTALHLFHSRKRSGAICFQKISDSGILSRSSFIGAIPRSVSENKYHPPKK